LFRHPYLKESFWKPLREEVDIGVLTEVRSKTDNTGVHLGSPNERFPKWSGGGLAGPESVGA
jgi:hypothetical protein